MHCLCKGSMHIRVAQASSVSDSLSHHCLPATRFSSSSLRQQALLRVNDPPSAHEAVGREASSAGRPPPLVEGVPACRNGPLSTLLALPTSAAELLTAEQAGPASDEERADWWMRANSMSLRCWVTTASYLHTTGQTRQATHEVVMWEGKGAMRWAGFPAIKAHSCTKLLSTAGSQ